MGAMSDPALWAGNVSTLAPVTLVTAVTPSHMKRLKWAMPTWRIKSQFRRCPLIIYTHGCRGPDLAWVRDVWPDHRFIEWDMPAAANDRERMISAFVLGAARDVQTDYYVKLDADCYFTSREDAFKPEDFESDLVSHKWGYTKPGGWVDMLGEWAAGKDWTHSEPDPAPRKHARIISFCCLHSMEFVREAARLAGDRLPVPSHDTYLWWLASRVKEFSWWAVNLKARGVGHNSSFRKLREGVCSYEGAYAPGIAKRLLDNVQLEITTECNLKCPNCDRACGEAPSRNCMSEIQVLKFVRESLDARQRTGHTWKRIDILGGEPLLHPRLENVLGLIDEYRQATGCRVRLTTNGTGPKVLKALAALPRWVKVRNSSEEKGAPRFDAYNIAPVDAGCRDVVGCSIPWRCGLGLTPHGYYLCGAGAGVARVFGLDIACRQLDDFLARPDVILAQRAKLCTLCGHSNATVKQTDRQETSTRWQQAFHKYKADPVYLPVY